MDHALTAAKAASPAASWSEVAAVVTAKTGTVVTADAVRNRMKRIDEQILLQEMELEPPTLDVPAAPFDKYVGFDALFWDLETTNLTAIMGRLLACAFADGFGRAKAFRIEDYPGRTPIDDSQLAIAIRDEIEKADFWVTWNGKMFDVPFLNARLLKAGVRPLRSDVKHVDLMYMAGAPFVRIGSRKLENVSKYVNSPNRKTPLDWETWQLAGLGDREAMDKVVEHAIADVLVTRDVFAHLKPHVRNIHR